MAFAGGSHCAVETGDWPRSFVTEIEGAATWDREAERFTAFELVGVGERSGRTRFNGREGDEGAAPIGVVLRLAAVDAPHVAPVAVSRYGWQPRARR